MNKQPRSMNLLKVVMRCKAATHKPLRGKGSFKRKYRNKKDELNYVGE